MKRALLFLQILLSPLFSFGLTYNVTVPTGTKACYIGGEMNGWSQQAMNKVDETHYTLDITVATTSQKYKYCSGPGWAYVENIADNRNYSENDVVTSWAAIYDPSAVATDITYTVTVPEGTDVCYFVGMPTNWAHKQMAKIDATHFKIIVNSTNKDSYKYCSGPDWAYEELDENHQTISNRNYNSSDVVKNWKQVYYSAPVGITYNVSVPSGTNTCFLSGDMNNWSFTPMIKTDDTRFMVNIPNANSYQKYIYYSGPNLSYIETKTDGSSVANRTFSYYDVVEKWSSTSSPSSSINLTSNFSQQSYECGTTLPITWTSSNVQNVKIYFSGDYGLNWTEVTSLSASAEMYNWTLPSTPLYQCKIKICDASDNLVSSVTRGMFVIYNHLPEKVEPLFDNYYQVFTYPYNDQYPVTTTADSDNINGKVGNACGPTAVSNILAYWEYPRKGFGSRTFTDVKNCTWSADFSSADYNYDLTNDKLTSSSPQTLIDANATLMYHAGVAMHDIYRSGNSVGVLNAFKQYFGYNIGITELCRDDYSPEQWEKIVKSELSLGRPQMIQGWANYFEDGGYGGHWFMCDGYSADNLFHISLDYGENGGRKYCPLYEFDYYKLRNWTFAYLVPEKNGKEIKLTFPSGSENWKQGTVKNIQWTSAGISNIKIEFSNDAGESWNVISDNVVASTGNYDITLPLIISTKCKIRISDASDINIYDRNKVNFSIYDTKTLELTSSIASSVQSGVVLPLRWTSKGIKTVAIEYSVNNGQSWNAITEKNAEDYVYKWTVPNITASNCKIKITDISDNSLYAESSAFAIAQNAIIGGPYAADENTLALYHFDYDYFNTVSNQTYATPFNTTNFISNNENKMDYAIKVDNSNSSVSSCVELPHETPLSLTGDWTIEFWFKINSWGGVSTAYPFMFIKSGANYFIFLDVASKSLHVGYDYDGGAETLYLPSNSLELNKWYHIIYIRNTSNSTLNCRLHDLNRQELISKSTNYNPLHVPKTNTYPINIGGYSGGSNVQFDGYVDEVRISNIVRDFSYTGLNSPKEEPFFSVYPNPSSGIIHLNFSKDITGGLIKITNLSGQEVYMQNTKDVKNGIISLSNLNKGVYFVHIFDKNSSWTEKIILK